MSQPATEPTTEPASTASKEKFPRWRRWTAGALIVISCVLVPLSVLAVWVRGQVLSTDRYVANITPLASNPAVIDTAATKLTNELFDNVDVKQIAEDALPPRAQFLASPLAAGVKEAVNRAAITILSSDQFKKVWIEANRVAHQQIVKALTNEGKVVKTPNGKIVLDLSALLGQVRQALDDRGITVFDKLKIQQLSLKFELMDSDQLAKAQTGAKLLKGLSWVLPVLALLALGVGLALSPNRRRSLLRWGIGAAVASSVIGASVTIGRSFYLDAVTSPDLSRETAAAVFDTLVRFLRQGARLMIAIGLVTALAAWVSGPSAAAVKVRATAKSLTGKTGDAASSHGWQFGAFGTWVSGHRNPLRIGSVLVVLLVLVAWDHPRALTVLFLVLVLLVLLAIIEIVARAAGGDVGPTNGSPPAATPETTTVSPT
jgi:hypothetical protein